MTGPGADVRKHPTASRPRVLQAVPDLDPPIDTKKGEPTLCRHRRVDLIEDERRVHCKDCAKILDPFDWALLLANDWRHYRWQHNEARAAISSLSTQVTELRREEARLKGRIKRGRPAEVERARVELGKAARVFSRVEEALVALGVARGSDPVEFEGKPTTVWHLLYSARKELERQARSLAKTPDA